MSTFAKIVRYFFSVILIFLLLVLFFVGVPLTSFSQVFVHRENVKEVINSSGIFDDFVDTMVDYSQNIEIAGSSEQIENFTNLLQEDTELKNTLNDLLSSDEMKAKVNIVIDSFYDWLEGKTNTLDFEVYLIEDQETFTEIFGSLMMLNFETLPTCGSTSDIDISDNPMNIECIPEGVDISNFDSFFKDTLITNESSMDDIVESFKFSSDQLNITDENTVLAQMIFRVVKVLPILLAIAVVVTTLFIILLIPGVKAGFVTTSIIYILVGIFFLVSTLLGNVTEILTSIDMSNMNISYAQVGNLTTNIMNPIFELISSQMRIYSYIILGVGVVLLLIGILVKKKVQEEIKNEPETTDKSQS